jgi:Protein of unknown function (DUF2911)
MKRSLRISLPAAFVLGLFMLSPWVNSAYGAERGKAQVKVGNADITIDYGRPTLQGRDPLKLIKTGEVWRIGANASTTIDSSSDLDFGGTVISKGNHILLARYDGPDKWSLIVSSKPWNEYEDSAKLASTPLVFKEISDSQEAVKIDLASKGGKAVITIAWGKMELTGSFSPAK